MSHVKLKNRASGDVISVEPILVDYYQAQGTWEQVLDPTEAEKVAEILAASNLRGEALDEALEEHDLPKSGKADEKRKLLVETIKEEGTDGSTT